MSQLEQPPGGMTWNLRFLLCGLLILIFLWLWIKSHRNFKHLKLLLNLISSYSGTLLILWPPQGSCVYVPVHEIFRIIILWISHRFEWSSLWGDICWRLGFHLLLLLLQFLPSRQHHLLQFFFCILDDSLPPSLGAWLIFFIQLLDLFICESLHEFLVEVESTQVWLQRSALLLQHELVPVDAGKEWVGPDFLELIVVAQTLLRVFLQKTLQNRFSVSREVLRIRSFLPSDVGEHLFLVAWVVGRQTRQKLIEKCTNLVIVKGSRVSATVQHLRANVLRTPTQRVGEIRLPEILLTESKVRQLDVTIKVYQNVFGLEVAIDDVFGVKIFDGENDFGNNQASLFLCKVLPVAQMKEEFSGWAELEDQVEEVLGVESVFKVDNERVLQPHQDISLEHDLLDFVARNDILFVHDFHGHQLSAGLHSCENDAWKAPFTNLPQQVIALYTGTIFEVLVVENWVWFALRHTVLSCRQELLRISRDRVVTKTRHISPRVVDLVDNWGQVGFWFLRQALKGQMRLREEEIQTIELLFLWVGQGDQLVVCLSGELNLPGELLLF